MAPKSTARTPPNQRSSSWGSARKRVEKYIDWCKAKAQVHDYWFACAHREERVDASVRRGGKGKNKNKGKGKGKQNTWKGLQWNDQSNDQWWKKQTWPSQWNTARLPTPL